MNGRCQRNRRPPVRAARARALPRYNDPVENRQARHIGEIISERYDLGLDNQIARAREIRRSALELRKIFWVLLGGALDALATIGWLVTLPFIAHDGPPLTTREQSRG